MRFCNAPLYAGHLASLVPAFAVEIDGGRSPKNNWSSERNVGSRQPTAGQASETADPLLREAVNFGLKRAALLAVIAEGILTLMDAIIKILSTRYPIFEITFLRFVSG